MILILISELALFHCPRWFQDLVQQNNTLIEEMLYLIIPSPAGWTQEPQGHLPGCGGTPTDLWKAALCVSG